MEISPFIGQIRGNFIKLGEISSFTLVVGVGQIRGNCIKISLDTPPLRPLKFNMLHLQVKISPFGKGNSEPNLEKKTHHVQLPGVSHFGALHGGFSNLQIPTIKHLVGG